MLYIGNESINNQYIKNQYIRLDKAIGEILKIDIKIEENEKTIEELEIKENEPNIIIAYGNKNKKNDYKNINKNVRILITDYYGLRDGLWREIPEYIEVVIINKVIIYDKKRESADKEFDFILYENKMNYDKKIERMIEEGKLNEYNILGHTVLTSLILRNRRERAIEIIAKMDKESINKVDILGYNGLIHSIIMKQEEVSLKLLEREEINVNQINKNGDTALIRACMGKMELVALKLLEREEIEVRHKNKNGKSAIDYVIKNNLEKIKVRILEKI